MLLDIDKLKKLDVKPGKELNLLSKHEEKLVSFLKVFKKSIGEDLYKSLYPQSSQPGIMYGSSKTHKLLVNGFNKLRSILKRELKKIWDMPVKVIPVVGALGTTPKKLKQHSN